MGCLTRVLCTLVLSLSVVAALPAFLEAIHAQRLLENDLMQRQAGGACVKYSKISCAKESEACGCPLGTSDECVSCDSGLECIAQKCTALPDIGQTCDASQSCYSPEGYFAMCTQGACKGVGVFAAGEKCSTDATQTANGGCLSGLSCDPTSTCQPLLAPGENCSAIPNACGPVAFCNAEGVCETLQKEGDTCPGNADTCSQSLDCVDHVCRPYFSQPAGAVCQADFFQSSCQPGLYCGDSGECSEPEGVGKTCDENTACGTGTTCACDSTTGKSSCVSLAHTKETANAIKAYVKCAEEHDANDNLQAFPGNKIAEHCLKEYQNVVGQLYGGGGCKSAGHRLYSTVIALVLALVLVMAF